jgi:phosphatidylethanolamine/phosphatidyl-N-methylethanolamine N-methyltransferase
MRDTLHFIGQMARRWRTTGAIAPSGTKLAEAMVRALGEIKEGETIIELGPGTGVFTREIYKRFPKNKIVAVEFNDSFADRLAKAMPAITVVQGCASKLDSHLDTLKIDAANVGGIISGLPLLSLPQDLPQKVLASIHEVLPVGRKYIQFTYSERAWQKFGANGFQRLPSRRVWLNIPPAVVMTFTRK